MKLGELSKLLACVPPPYSEGDVEILGVTEDSRRVKAGFVFVAAPGVRADGHDYAEQAVKNGAVAIIGDRYSLESLQGVPYFGVAMPRAALGVLAHALQGDPSRKMCVIGITGTNGKSSSVTLIQHILEHCGHSTSVFGTIGYLVAGEMIPAPHTTPFGEDLAVLFGRAYAAGQRHVVMEVSSHALDQERVGGIEFHVAAFTNLTQDHLDYHHDMDEYRRAKLKLFERVEGGGRFTVVNAEDPSAPAFIDASHVPCYTYGDTGMCRAETIRMDLDKTRFQAVTPWGNVAIETTLLGHHNVMNILGVIAICGGLGLKLESISAAIASLASVPGRFERIDAGQDFHVVVDYAHTEDGLRNVLAAARTVCDGKVLTVFGCGGDRDRTKRPKMGCTAVSLGDFSIITSDNPRTEDPLAIIEEIEVGVREIGKQRDVDYVVIPDRLEAIQFAIKKACPGDLVLIAGKGHEDYQIMGTEKIHFDDREVARAILAELTK